MDDKLLEDFWKRDVWESIGSVDDFWNALNKKEGKKEKLTEIRACANDYEA